MHCQRWIVHLLDDLKLSSTLVTVVFVDWHLLVELPEDHIAPLTEVDVNQRKAESVMDRHDILFVQGLGTIWLVPEQQALQEVEH